MRDREPHEDPFVDIESQLLGEADVWLNALANMVEFSAETSVLSVFGQVEGKMNLELNPCDKNGNTGPWEDEEEELDPFVDDPNDLLNTNITFEVKITNLAFDPQLAGNEGLCKYENVFVRYKFNAANPDEEWSSTDKDTNGEFNTIFNYSKKHKLHVDEETLLHITKGKITFQLWGNISSKAMQAVRPGTADNMSSRLEAKKRELEQLEYKVSDMQKMLEEKNQQIAEANRELVELDKLIAMQSQK